MEIMPIALETILPLRDAYRREMDCQIIHDSIHTRPGWSREYLVTIAGVTAGYGSVAHGGPWRENPVIYEFYLTPGQRQHSLAAFQALVRHTQIRRTETQTNDPHLIDVVRGLGLTEEAGSRLFADRVTTQLAPAGATYRVAQAADELPISAAQLPWHGVVELEGRLAGWGGILLHYNPPYADIYMEIAESYRRRGLGSFLVQELKRQCRALGRLPGARCNPTNEASRRTLIKAGFEPCGRMVTAECPAPPAP